MHVVLAILLLLWLSSAAYYIISAWCLRSFYKNSFITPPSPSYLKMGTGGGVTSYPPITVLKPIKGADDALYENLKSFVEQDYPRF